VIGVPHEPVESNAPVKYDWINNSRFGGETTTPVSNGDLTYIADTHEHRIDASRNGSVVWSYTAGGRIMSSPVLVDGYCVFGSCDGWVYCLDAETGELAWRFMAAPYDRKITAYGQLESSWPVMGVAVQGSNIFTTAGVHPSLGGAASTLTASICPTNR
jgi:outer membrane protein assembly factor BamB